MKSIRGRDVTPLRAPELSPGMLTHDGLILGIRAEPNGYFVYTPQAVIVMSPADTIQVYARLDSDATDAAITAFAEHKERS